MRGCEGAPCATAHARVSWRKKPVCLLQFAIQGLGGPARRVAIG